MTDEARYITKLDAWELRRYRELAAHAHILGTPLIASHERAPTLEELRAEYADRVAVRCEQVRGKAEALAAAEGENQS